MPFKVGDPRPPNAGRRAGTPNKRTAAVRDVIQLAAYQLGGWQRLVQWIEQSPENETVFWSTIFPRLLPRTGTGESGEFALNAQTLADVMGTFHQP